MSDRRTFFKHATVGALGFALPEQVALHADSSEHKVAIITNTLRNEMKADYRKAYETLSEIGYQQIEGSNVPEDMTTQEYLYFLDSLGLEHIATGANMSGMEREGIGQYLEKAEGLGAKYIVCYYPWVTSAENLEMPEVMETAARINKYGKLFKEAGFRFAWHNHDKEFADVEGKAAFDLLMQNTDPDYSTVELDWYWVVKGGHDPALLFEKYPGRFELAHVKDMNNNRNMGKTCVGNGIIDFEPIFKKAPLGGVKHFIVENESAIDGYACARGSYHHIVNMLEQTKI